MRHAVSTVLTLFLCVLSLSARAVSETINFDDIDATAGDVILDNLNPYHGFNFTNFSVYTSVPGFPGYNNGIVSGPNAAYTSGDALGSPIVSTITASTPFDFDTVELGSGWYDGLNVTLVGLSSGAQVYSKTVTVDTEGAQLFNFAFDGISELEIYSTVSAGTTDPYGCGPSGCSQITLDDLTLVPDTSPAPVPSSVPEPSSLILTGLGAVSVATTQRFRFPRR